jgi:N6-adenosine-specific RNA methylase IME4
MSANTTHNQIARQESPGLEQLAHARALLEATRDLSEVREIRDRALALEEYARAKQLGQEAERFAAEIAVRAERRYGQLLAEAPKDPGGRPPKTGAAPELVSPHQEAGKKLSSRSQRLARIPEEEFEQELASSKRPSASRLAAEVKRRETLDRIRAGSTGSGGSAPLDRIPRCPVVLADPPWRYEQGTVRVAADAIENHYPTMALDDIKALDVPAAADAALFLWAPSPKLPEALEVLNAWGFTYRTCAVWVKDRIGMGYYFRQRHELLLVGIRGNLPVPAEGSRPDSVIEAPRLAHSQKPPVVHDLIDAMYPGIPKVELFARIQRPGWYCWGNEVPS